MAKMDTCRDSVGNEIRVGTKIAYSAGVVGSKHKLRVRPVVEVSVFGSVGSVAVEVSCGLCRVRKHWIRADEVAVVRTPRNRKPKAALKTPAAGTKREIMRRNTTGTPDGVQ